MRMYDILEHKKNKKELTKEEIEFFVREYTLGNIPDYQMSALLMAIVINGMTDCETIALTLAMTNSGEKINLNFNNTVDKHSTGGIGDKITLIVAPIVACLNCKIGKMSGRGLGYTGGTIDKLESIAGFKVKLDENNFKKQINEIGLAIISQTKNIAPADKKIYALRDVTATVESMPLIASSIMSKKIASGAKNLVLDVKVGNGAFMKNIEDAKKLAHLMVKIGNSVGIKTVAILTNMNEPLGKKIGNFLEVEEAIDILSNKGPKDTKNIAIEIAAQMVSITNVIPYEIAKNQVIEVLENGDALNKFYDFINYQDGNINISYVSNKPKYKYEVFSNKKGYISEINTEEMGKISILLGAGRVVKEDIIDYSAGIELNKKVNDYIENNELLGTLYTSKEINISMVKGLFLNSILVKSEKIKEMPLILDIIGE